MQRLIRLNHPIGLLVLLWSCCTTVSKGNTILYEAPNIDITTDVGYFISIDNTNPITVTSNRASADPIHSYQGSATYTFESNFFAQIITDIKPTSPAGGTWSATANPDAVEIGSTQVTITVNVDNLDVTKLIGGTQGAKIAELTISILPTIN